MNSTKRKSTSAPTMLGLTETDHKILELTALGYTSKEIAVKINLSETAVDKLRAEMINKTHSRNTASLVSFAYKFGLLKV